MQSKLTTITKHEQGFTLVELVITILIISILLAIYTPNLQTSVKNERISATINELDILASAAQNYATLNRSDIDTAGSLTYAFPDQNNQCTDAIAVMSSAAFIVGISPSSTWYGEQFSTTCTTQTFSIGLNIDDIAYANHIKSVLGAVTTTGGYATYTVGKPTLLPIIDDYIGLLDGSTDTWDAQSKTIANVADVSYTFGKKASQAVYDLGLICNSNVIGDCPFASNYPNQPNLIDKPACESSPTFLITGIGIWGINDTIDKWFLAVVRDEPNHWELNFRIGNTDPSSQTYWSYVTKCE